MRSCTRSWYPSLCSFCKLPCALCHGVKLHNAIKEENDEHLSSERKKWWKLACMKCNLSGYLLFVHSSELEMESTRKFKRCKCSFAKFLRNELNVWVEVSLINLKMKKVPLKLNFWFSIKITKLFISSLVAKILS
jgi:hypothetical protein